MSSLFNQKLYLWVALIFFSGCANEDVTNDECPVHHVKLKSLERYFIPRTGVVMLCTGEYMEVFDEKAYPYATPWQSVDKKAYRWTEPHVVKVCSKCDERFQYALGIRRLNRSPKNGTDTGLDNGNHPQFNQ